MSVIANLWGVTIDCPRPRELAEFYQRIGGGEIFVSDDFFTELRIGAFSIGFQRDPHHRPPTWPDPEVPQQCHVDFSTPDLDGAEAQALEAGAVKATHQPEPEVFRVLLDPAGHPFCLSIWGTPAFNR